MKKIGPYTKKVIKNFQNPKNYGRMDNPDGLGKVGNLICGDVMWLYIKIGKNKKREEVIRDIKFETFGCVVAIATSSAITELAKGKTLKAAMKIGRNEIIESLGGLPPIKIHCSVLAASALTEAIHDYFSKNKKEIPEKLEEEHQRLSKEKKEIEENYKDLIKIEEKIHKGNKKTR